MDVCVWVRVFGVWVCGLPMCACCVQIMKWGQLICVYMHITWTFMLASRHDNSFVANFQEGKDYVKGCTNISQYTNVIFWNTMPQDSLKRFCYFLPLSVLMSLSVILSLKHFVLQFWLYHFCNFHFFHYYLGLVLNISLAS